MDKRILIGCVADDFTGASDAASFLISKGLKTVLFNGIPKCEIEDCDSVVIALKSRTQEISSALADTKDAFDWLKDKGAEHLYFKYCSTFDSTPKGNIGPVVDMLLETSKEKYTILSPALPVNGRSVKKGILYVDGVPLSQTHMKNHPLTPMWESEIAELMKQQGKYNTLNVDYQMLEKSKEEVLTIVEEFGKGKEHFYVVPDYINEKNGEKVAEIFGHLKVLTGGSGILAPLASLYKQRNPNRKKEVLETATYGKGLVLSGSCSKATLAQIIDFQEKGYKSYKIDPIALLNKLDSIENICDFINQNNEQEVIIYSSDNTENIMEIQKQGIEMIASILEKTMADLAKYAIDNGFTRIVVAGGETSSEVVKALGYNGFEIGESAAPGVPVMAPLSNSKVRVVLKSGNFGQVDFFERAIKMTRK